MIINNHSKIQYHFLNVNCSLYQYSLLLLLYVSNLTIHIFACWKYLVTFIYNIPSEYFVEHFVLWEIVYVIVRVIYLSNQLDASSSNKQIRHTGLFSSNKQVHKEISRLNFFEVFKQSVQIVQILKQFREQRQVVRISNELCIQRGGKKEPDTFLRELNICFPAIGFQQREQPH